MCSFLPVAEQISNMSIKILLILYDIMYERYSPLAHYNVKKRLKKREIYKIFGVFIKNKNDQ